MIIAGRGRSSVRRTNMTAKKKIKGLVDEQPGDATYDENLREPAFARMIERGLADVREGRSASHEDVDRRVRH